MILRKTCRIGVLIADDFVVMVFSKDTLKSGESLASQ